MEWNAESRVNGIDGDGLRWVMRDLWPYINRREEYMIVKYSICLHLGACEKKRKHVKEAEL